MKKKKHKSLMFDSTKLLGKSEGYKKMCTDDRYNEDLCDDCGCCGRTEENE